MKFKNIKCQDINDSSFKTVNFFNDEFTNHLDTQIGIDAIEPFEALNYEVKFIEHKESGRSFLSQKGFLKKQNSWPINCPASSF